MKGRDWYDFIWFVSKGIPLHLAHLEERMRQSGDWKEEEALTPALFLPLLEKKIRALSISMAKNDLLPFVRDKRRIEIWSEEFFLSLLSKIAFV